MKQLIMAAGLAVMLTACGTSEMKTVEGENPFFAEYTTPFGVPPFDQIKFEHYKKESFLTVMSINTHNSENFFSLH